jgi:predicted lipoprotein
MSCIGCKIDQACHNAYTLSDSNKPPCAAKLDADLNNILSTEAFQSTVEAWMHSEGFGTGECNRVSAARRLVDLLNTINKFAK